MRISKETEWETGIEDIVSKSSEIPHQNSPFPRKEAFLFFFLPRTQKRDKAICKRKEGGKRRRRGGEKSEYCPTHSRPRLNPCTRQSKLYLSFAPSYWTATVSQPGKRTDRLGMREGLWRRLKRKKKEREKERGKSERYQSPSREEKRSDLPSTEPSICETSDVEGKTGTDDQTRRLQHLRHAYAQQPTA